MYPSTPGVDCDGHDDREALADPLHGCPNFATNPLYPFGREGIPAVEWSCVQPAGITARATNGPATNADVVAHPMPNTSSRCQSRPRCDADRAVIATSCLHGGGGGT
jgi:hypothetical protein